MDDNKGLTLEDVKEVLREGHSQIEGVIRREVDSLDDFEHLGHDDSSPLKEATSKGTRDEINIGVGLANPAATKFTTNNQQDELSSFDPFTSSPPTAKKTMDSNLLEMGDHFPDRKEADDKIDKFLQEMSSFAPPKHQEQPEIPDKDEYFKSSTQSFVDAERGPPAPAVLIPPKKTASNSSSSGVEQLEKYSDSEPEDDDFKPSKYDDFPKKAELPESFGSFDNFKNETFKDVEEIEPEPPRKDYPAPPLFDDGKVSPIPPSPQKEEKLPEPVKVPTPEPEIQPTPTCKLPLEKKDTPIKPRKSNVIDAEAIFCRMGLDTWFNPERLNPKVESLIYWRDPKKSGPVFGGVLLILLSLTYFSLISVVAYLSLAALTGTISFRIYKNIVQAVQKTGDGHPFKDLLEYDVSLPQEKVKDVSEIAVAHVNAGVSELRRLFLVEDLVDSIKFGVLLWTLTYLGSWFNGMTLIIIGWVALFSLPKVYETNKTQIDANLEIVRTKLAEITSKVKAAIPIGKKAEEKKEQ